MSSLYGLLGIERSAGPMEIKRAWRKLAWENHPDRGMALGWSARQAAEHLQRYRQGAAAYQVLSEPTSKREYDQQLDALRADFLWQRQQESARSRYSTTPPKPWPSSIRPSWEGVDVEQAMARVRNHADKQRRIEASKAAYRSRKEAFRAEVAALTQQILAEILLEEMEELGL